MSERTIPVVRLELDAEREGLAGDLDALRGSVRPLLPVAAGILLVLFLLGFRRKRSKRGKRSERSEDVPRVKLLMLALKIFLKLLDMRRRDRAAGPPAPAGRPVVVAAAAPVAPWPAAPGAA